MNEYDWALFRRTLFAFAVLLALTTATVVTTDEATSTAGMRLARIAALVPLLVIVAILAIAGHARVRGELRAVEALGVSPWIALRGAERAGAAVAAMSVLVLVAPFTDAASLLPAFTPPIDWTMASDGTRATAPGLVVLANGVIEATRAATAPTFHRVSPWAAVPCLAPIACVVSAWAATPMQLVLRLFAGASTALLAVVGLHLVAAARAPSWLAAAASLPMAFSLWQARR
ncbi:MAG TPA: hypothetical protein VHC69_13705 [Polyangiaceae bacterium]|nr:hypothetical protein [Polyangiaceae bacterium]